MKENRLNKLSEQYVKLALRVGLHDPYLVDAYYGPPDWRTAEIGSADALEELIREVGAIETALDASADHPFDEIERLRYVYVRSHLTALRTRLRMLSGEQLSFDEESQGLYAVTSPRVETAELEAALAEADAILSGPGSLTTRLHELRNQVVVPPERVDAVFGAAVNECRQRTKRFLSLPEGEQFTTELVTGQPWSAYNWFKGSAKSLIQINMDLPLHIDRVLMLAAHEGYPGHHVHHSLLERHLLIDRGWVEFSLNLLFSPQSLIAEGVANNAKRIAFPKEQSKEFERDVLCKLAGGDSHSLIILEALKKPLRKLKYAGNEAARRYLEGTISEGDAIEYLERYSLMDRPRAEQRVKFIERYRAYVITYNVGEDLVKAHLDRMCGQDKSSENAWRIFGELLSKPFIAASL